VIINEIIISTTLFFKDMIGVEKMITTNVRYLRFKM